MGGYLLGGYSQSEIGYDKSEASRGAYDYWIVKISSTGVKVWDKTYGGYESDNLYDLLATPDGGYLLGGASNSNLEGDKSEASKGYLDYWVVKINRKGEKEWDKTIGGNGSDYLNTLSLTADKNFLLGGSSWSNASGDKSETSNYDNDYWIVKIDSNGSKIWDKTVGGSVYDYLQAVAATPDGGYLLGGNSNSGISRDKSEAKRGETDYWIVKIKDLDTPYNPYCVPTINQSCDNGTVFLDTFNFNTLSNNYSGCNGGKNNYKNYNPEGNFTTDVKKGRSYNVSFTGDQINAQSYGVWIDYNNDNDFADAGEFVYGSPSAVNTPVNGIITIPAGVPGGLHRMRVRTRYDYTFSNLESCTTAEYGETEDYTITISDCAPSYSISCSAGYYINNFSLNTLGNYYSGCNGQEGSYIKYEPSGSLTTTLNKGQNYTISLQSGPSYAQGFGVWIDYNDDQDFNDANEFIYSSPVVSSDVVTATIAIPLNVMVGTHRLRVRSTNSIISNSANCAELTYGETEDYTITIAEPIVSNNQWNLRYGGTGNENFTTIIKTADGGYLSGGYSNSNISGDKSQISQGKSDFWIIKSDKNGKKLWDKTYGGSDDDYLNRIIQTLDGGYLLAGSSLSGSGVGKSQSSRGDRDYWVVKISNTGLKQWDKRFGGSGYDELKKVIQLSTGEYILAGYSNSQAGGDKSQASQGGADFWLVKIGSSGNKIWDKRYGGNLNDLLNGIVETADGGFALAGSSVSGKSGDKSQISKGGSDFWLIRIDKNGKKLWDKTYGGSGKDESYSLGRNGNEFFIAGQSDSPTSGDKTRGTQGGLDFWLLKLNSSGGKIWDKRYGGNKDDELRASIQTKDGGYILAGKSFSDKSGNKSQNSQGLSDYWIVKIDKDGLYQWDKRFGGSGTEELRAATQTADGGLLLAGKSNSDVSGDITQPSQGGNDFWLVKVAPETKSIVATREVVVTEETLTSFQSLNFNAYPNPATNRVNVTFTLPVTQNASLKVFDSQGKELATLFQGEAKAKQKYEVKWEVNYQAAGMYLIQLQMLDEVKSLKILVTK